MLKKYIYKTYLMLLQIGIDKIRIEMLIQLWVRSFERRFITILTLLDEGANKMCNTMVIKERSKYLLSS